MIRHRVSYYPGVVILLLLCSMSFFMGCTTTSQKNLEQLNKVLRIYNNAFESKTEDGGSMYVQNDYRMDYLLKYGDIQGRVSFLDVQTLNHAYFKNKKPITLADMDDDDDKEGFNEAVITMRYRLTILPNNQVKTFIHEQRWKHDGALWRLEPNLEPFLK